MVDRRATRWLVVGHRGMLGVDLMGVLAGRDVVGIDLPDIDITDASSVDDLVPGHDIVVNCAAFTAVDAAETCEDEAYVVNAQGPLNLARACAANGAKLLHVSTDYVFSGDASEPYAEVSPVDPRTAYGRTKAAGEIAVREVLPADSWVLRTAWLYGAAGPNFVRRMAELSHELETIDVVDDQVGQPTWATDLARRIVAVVDGEIAPGTYHATAAGQTTWFGLARRIFELLGADPQRVRATTSEAFVRPAPRPKFSVLGHHGWATTSLSPMRDWSEALDEAWPLLGLK